MTYLASYSGLERLKIDPSNEHNQSPRALSALLVAQRASLRELFASGKDWSYTSPLSPALRGCMVLEVLRLSIDLAEVVSACPPNYLVAVMG